MFSTCRFCSTAIYSEVVNGKLAWVADDGWGTICGDAPAGFYAHQASDLDTEVLYIPVPAMDACRA